jgi:hypothetical protein
MLFNKHVYRVLQELEANDQYLSTLPTTGLREYVLALAEEHGAVYQRTKLQTPILPINSDPTLRKSKPA